MTIPEFLGFLFVVSLTGSVFVYGSALLLILIERIWPPKPYRVSESESQRFEMEELKRHW